MKSSVRIPSGFQWGASTQYFMKIEKEMYLMEPKWGTSDDLSKYLRPGGERNFQRILSDISSVT